MKICTKCKGEFPATFDYFYRDKKLKSGLSSWCKPCRNKQNKQYFEQNLDKIQDYQKRYREEHKEEASEYNKKYRVENAERLKEYQESIRGRKIYLCREWHKRNKEQQREYQRQNHKQNADKIKQQRRLYMQTEQAKKLKSLCDQRRRSRKNQLPTSFSQQDWERCLMQFGNRCAYCWKNSDGLQKEHFIPLSKGGEFTTQNIIPACKSCNSSKINKDFFEWYNKQDFYSKQREEDILSYLGYKNGIQQLSIL